MSESKKKRKSKYTYYRFTSDHPLYSSHHIRLSPDNESIVVNFIGANLPQYDQGDREYYCSTMLTLFKPWRTGEELKTDAENWDSAFSNHTFNAEQQSLMKNANIRYECLDAKDDYHAQMQKNMNVLPTWEENSHSWDDIEADGNDLFNTTYPINDNDESVNLDLLQLGKAEVRQLRDIMTMRNIMTNLGWTRESHNAIPCPDVSAN
ncbi:hypothetical protein L208DRAFT_1241818 [Tricholoma matsutake]|nr:hypothetical protein L208DRAFT_1241818 [Tricholoma matsutake 945]